MCRDMYQRQKQEMLSRLEICLAYDGSYGFFTKYYSYFHDPGTLQNVHYIHLFFIYIDRIEITKHTK